MEKLKYQTGQQWSYHTRPCDTGSTLLIIKVDTSPQQPPIIHVCINHVHLAGQTSKIEHMPFSAAAMDQSVIALLASHVHIDQRLYEGWSQWLANQGGVFDITVAEAIDATLSALPQDPFDATVLKMRAERSHAMIDALYHQLFQLPQWYFLCEPDDPRRPVQWVFPEGHNTTPALLAFTSHERATTAAIALGVYPAGAKVSVMPAPVRDAVQWLNSSDCENTWLCFNLTFENFPLYCDHAAELLANA